MRLEEENQAKFLELEEKITAHSVRQEEDYQARFEEIEEEFQEFLQDYHLWCQKKDEEKKAWEEKTSAHNLQMEEEAKGVVVVFGHEGFESTFAHATQPREVVIPVNGGPKDGPKTCHVVVRLFL